MEKFILAAAITICFSILTGVSQAETPAITVSAAISLKNAFEEIGKLYESGSNVKVVLNFGASGDLARQIAGGAPADVFASAAHKDMDMLDGNGFLSPGTRVNFAGNPVVLIVPLHGPLLKGFDDLNTPAVKKIATGNPKTVPAGRYAAEVLDYYKLSGAIKDKLVFTENVRQALDYVASGEVDAGIVYATDAAVRARDVKLVFTAPEGSHKPVVYQVAVVKSTGNEASAKGFISLVLSPAGQSILKKYGFQTAR
ncbi:MAG: molybdate ABC transporter substrate-binding protein [Nitrospirae bacterium]|nr:molybdate ABC transporter substrate-binding protein [Nitrospirota bacterium]